jgi:hypothetical protein
LAGNSISAILVRRSTMLLLLSCAAFALAGAVSRMILVSVHSRFQILAFWIAAVFLQLAAPGWFSRSPGKAARFAFVWNAAAATFAIIVTRILLEGLPYKLQSVISAIRA